MMIDLYYWPIPNGDKIAIFLEESGLEYQFIREARAAVITNPTTTPVFTEDKPQ